jgi:hypothetical protein
VVERHRVGGGCGFESRAFNLPSGESLGVITTGRSNLGKKRELAQSWWRALV